MRETIFRRTGSIALFCASLLTLAGCGSDSDGGDYQPEQAVPGLIFSYPLDGQSSVPANGRFYLTFSSAIDSDRLGTDCEFNNGIPDGSFCLIDSSDNLISAADIDLVQTEGYLRFSASSLAPGETYRLFVRDSLLDASNTNLPESEPVLSFRTTQTLAQAGSSPTLIAFNGENPAVFDSAVASADRPTAAFPLLDNSTLRLVFSEPLDESTLVAGDSVTLVLVEGANETTVAGTLWAKGEHLVFDPSEDLTPGASYQLRLTSAIEDKGGESLAAANYEFSPLDSDPCQCGIQQQLNLMAALGDSDHPSDGELSRLPLNRADLYSPLTGSRGLNIADTTLTAELGDPSAFGGLIPLTIRKGVSLDISELALDLGGEVSMDQATGAIKAILASDVNGFIRRNPYQAADIVPDDERAPLIASFTLDLALSAEDAKGNAILSQIIPNVEVIGTAVIEDGALILESVSSTQVNALGLDIASQHLVLGLATDPDAAEVAADTALPRLTASYPEDGADDVGARDRLTLLFSENMESAGIAPQSQISLINLDDSNNPVPFQLQWDGAAVSLKPTSPLNLGERYQIQIGALYSLAGNPFTSRVSDAAQGDNIIQFTVENPDISTPRPPMVSSIYKGIPCALFGLNGLDPGSCIDPRFASEGYLPISVPGNAPLEVVFNQVMDVATFTLGTSCGTGAIRVERVNTANQCQEPVAGTLLVDDRRFRFVPNDGWQAGQRYQLTLVAGSDGNCDANEICGANGVALNTDPLNGIGDAAGGGANLINVFEASAASDDRLLPLTLYPITDLNGNGQIDSGETTWEDNSARLGIIDFGGIITSALIDGEDTTYLSGALPVSIGSPEPLTVDGSEWDMTLEGDYQIPIELSPGILYGTSIRLDTSVEVLFLNLDINDVDTNTTLMRVREPADGPNIGYIVREAGVDAPQYIIQLDLYFDAPNMNISVAGVLSVSHNLHSYPLSVTLKGPVTFLDDGRLKIDLANVDAVPIDVVVDSLGFTGNIDLNIAAGSMQIQLLGDPVRGRY